MPFVSIWKTIRRYIRTNTLYHIISTIKSMNETRNKWIDHSVNNCDVLRDLIHVLEDKIDFSFRSKICSWPSYRPRPSAYHTCFSTPDWRFAAFSYRRPDFTSNAFISNASFNRYVNRAFWRWCCHASTVISLCMISP